MRRTLHISAILALFMGISMQSFAQQEPMFTKYMFNSLATNPAYAGSLDYMSVRVLHRSQWLGIEGGPMTQTLTLHSPFKKKVGLGLTVANDEIGSTGTSLINGIYAYKIPFGEGNLAIGLQGGVMNWRSDWTDLKYKDAVELDNVYADMGDSRWIPNVGAGIYYSTRKLYVGFSVPRMLGFDLRDPSGSVTDEWAKIYRHYYFTAGGVIPLKGRQLMFKPSIMVKTIGLLGDFSTSITNPEKVGAPAAFDIDLSLLFYETFWIGASFRSAFAAKQFGGASSFDSADIWASYNMANGFRLGLSYDYTLSKLNDFSKGTFEVMLGYDFTYTIKKVNTPRYF